MSKIRRATIRVHADGSETPVTFEDVGADALPEDVDILASVTFREGSIEEDIVAEWISASSIAEAVKEVDDYEGGGS